LLLYIFFISLLNRPSRTGLKALGGSADPRLRSEETHACGSTSSTWFCRPKRVGLQIPGARVAAPARRPAEALAPRAWQPQRLGPAGPPCPTKICTDCCMNNIINFNISNTNNNICNICNINNNQTSIQCQMLPIEKTTISCWMENKVNFICVCVCIKVYRNLYQNFSRVSGGSKLSTYNMFTLLISHIS